MGYRVVDDGEEPELKGDPGNIFAPEVLEAVGELVEEGWKGGRREGHLERVY